MTETFTDTIRTAIHEKKRDRVFSGTPRVFVHPRDYQTLHEVEQNDEGVVVIPEERVDADIEAHGALDEGDVALVFDTDDEQYSYLVPEDVFNERFAPHIEKSASESDGLWCDQFTLTVQFDANHVERKWEDAADDNTVRGYTEKPRPVRDDQRDLVSVKLTFNQETLVTEQHEEQLVRDQVAQTFLHRINESTGGVVSIPVLGEKRVMKDPDEPVVTMAPDDEPPQEMTFEEEIETVKVAEDHYQVGEVLIPPKPRA